LFSPGTAFSYGDAGDTLASAIVEQVTKKSFLEVVADELRPIEKAASNNGLADRIIASDCLLASGGGKVTISASDLAMLARLHISPQLGGLSGFLGDHENTWRAGVDFPGWTAMGLKACLGWYEFASGWYGYNAGDELQGSLLVRFNPESGAVIAIVSKKVAAYQVYFSLFRDRIPECRQLKPQRFLTSEEIDAVVTDEYLGHYESGGFAIDVKRSDSHKGLTLSLHNRFADIVKLKKLHMAKMRLTINNGFFLEPPGVPLISYGQFLGSTKANGNSAFLWNGRQLWRKV
jgi:hypothetical protein